MLLVDALYLQRTDSVSTRSSSNWCLLHHLIPACLHYVPLLTCYEKENYSYWQILISISAYRYYLAPVLGLISSFLLTGHTSCRALAEMSAKTHAVLFFFMLEYSHRRKDAGENWSQQNKIRDAWRAGEGRVGWILAMDFPGESCNLSLLPSL